MERRKVTYKLYPSSAVAERLTAWTRLHCELYNAALQERIDAHRKAGKSISYFDQQNVLPEIKAARPEYVELGSHALQQTLRKLDLSLPDRPRASPASRPLRASQALPIPILPAGSS